MTGTFKVKDQSGLGAWPAAPSPLCAIPDLCLAVEISEVVV